MAKKNEIEIAVAEVVDYIRMTGGFAPALQAVVARRITEEAARKAGLKVSNAELQRAADAFRVANGLNKASDTDAWLKANGIMLETFEGFLETSLLVNKYKDFIQKKVKTAKYLQAPGIKDSIREMVYQDWLAKALK
jgi:cellobiose-specific phosphotransferase system component IIB